MRTTDLVLKDCLLDRLILAAAGGKGRALLWAEEPQTPSLRRLDPRAAAAVAMHVTAKGLNKHPLPLLLCYLAFNLNLRNGMM